MVCSEDETGEAYTEFGYSSGDNDPVTKHECFVKVVCAFII